MLKLVKMSEEYAEQLTDMMDEWTAAGERIIPCAICKHDFHDLKGYIESLEVKEAGNGLVPDSTFFGLDTERNLFVGAVNIRHWLNEGLLRTGGHIGDGVRPGERGKGYGTRLVALALEECKKLGIERVLMCCDKDNVASARTIQKNGGALENEVEDGGRVVRRYWIDLRGPVD